MCFFHVDRNRPSDHAPRALTRILGDSDAALMHPGTDFILCQEVFDDFQPNAPLTLDNAAQIRPAVFPTDGIVAVEVSQTCHAFTPNRMQLGFALHITFWNDDIGIDY
jgi:hypothetical protein